MNGLVTILATLLIAQISQSANFQVVQTPVFSNAIAQAITVKFRAVNTNCWLSEYFTPSLSGEWFYINAWGIAWSYVDVFQRTEGSFQIQSVKTSKWVVAWSNGNSSVDVASAKAQGWETFKYVKVGSDAIKIMKGVYYLTLVNGKMMATETNSSKAEVFQVQQINQRLNQKISGVNLGS